MSLMCSLSSRDSIISPAECPPVPVPIAAVFLLFPCWAGLPFVSPTWELAALARLLGVLLAVLLLLCLCLLAALRRLLANFTLALPNTAIGTSDPEGVGRRAKDKTRQEPSAGAATVRERSAVWEDEELSD